jgi:hypothetical protein
MSYDLQRLRLNHSIPMDDMVKVAQEIYPKLDKPLLSKTMNDGYGIDLKPDAVKALAQTYDPEGWDKRREKDRHTLKLGVRCRLTEEEFNAFSIAWRAAGYSSANECVRSLIHRYLRDNLLLAELIEEERIDREKELWRNLTEEETLV